MEVGRKVIETLSELLRRRGEEPTPKGSGLALDGAIEVACLEVDRQDREETQVLGLLMETRAGEGGLLVREWVAAAAGSLEAAVDAVLDDYVILYLEPLRAAIEGEAIGEARDRYEAELSDGRQVALEYAPARSAHLEAVLALHVGSGTATTHSWEGYASPYRVAGDARTRDEVSQHLAHLPPVVLVMQPLALAAPRDGSSCSLKLWMGRSAQGEVTVECRLGSESWPEGTERLSEAAALPGFPLLPEGRGYVSVSQLIVLRPRAADA